RGPQEACCYRSVLGPGWEVLSIAGRGRACEAGAVQQPEGENSAMRKSLRAAAGAAALTLLLAGCGAGAVSAADVEEQAENQLEQQVGQRPDIACEEDLPAEVDASIRCELTAGEGKVAYGVSVPAADVRDVR